MYVSFSVMDWTAASKVSVISSGMLWTVDPSEGSDVSNRSCAEAGAAVANTPSITNSAALPIVRRRCREDG